MKHATAAALDRLEPLIERIRALGVLKEKSRGVFYFKSRAYLHFHEDPAGLFVDVRSADGKDFDRMRVDVAEGTEALVERVRAVIGPPTTPAHPDESRDPGWPSS
ncbi:MAG TPA: hypothetical protein VF459_02975 [Caulobacteraceae bacterium]